MQTHPFLSNYITTQITTPFWDYQQDVRDYLDQCDYVSYRQLDLTLDDSDDDEEEGKREGKKGEKGGKADKKQQQQLHFPPSPLQSFIYYDYQKCIQDIKAKLYALSSADWTTPCFQLLINKNNKNNNIENNNNNDTKLFTPLLFELPPFHTYQHAHPCDYERTRLPQRAYQRIFQSTQQHGTMLLPPSTITTNTSLHSFLNHYEKMVYQTSSDVLQSISSTHTSATRTPSPPRLEDHQIVEHGGGDEAVCLLLETPTQSSSLQHTISLPEEHNDNTEKTEQQQQQDRFFSQITNETIKELFMQSKQHNDELTQQLEDQQHHIQTLEKQLEQSITNSTPLQQHITQLQQQLEVKDQHLHVKDKQLHVKDKQLAEIQQNCKEQLAAKDKQIQQLMEMMMAMNITINNNRG